MKKRSIAMVCTAAWLATASCEGNHSQTTAMEQTENKTENTIFPRGTQGPSEWFTGTTWVEALVDPDEIEGLYSVGQVTFEPGSRTLWHTHPAGQVLLVTEGKGWYQERGKEARELGKGDVVVIPKEVEHWHGAAADSRFVHIAVSNMREGSNVTWTTPVTETEYGAVK